MQKLYELATHVLITFLRRSKKEEYKFILVSHCIFVSCCAKGQTMHTLQSKRRRRVWRDDHLYTRGSKRESEGGYWRWGVSQSCVQVASTAVFSRGSTIIIIIFIGLLSLSLLYTYNYYSYRSSAAVPFSKYYFANFVCISIIILHFFPASFLSGYFCSPQSHIHNFPTFFHSLDFCETRRPTSSTGQLGLRLFHIQFETKDQWWLRLEPTPVWA